MKLVLARLRGFCAGVERAVDAVKLALALCDGPVYVRRQIIHNRRVVDDLAARGAVFVDELDDVPEGAWVIFSAHGVAPEIRRRAADRRLRVIDATCPLVGKVHSEAQRFALDGHQILLIGHAGHDEIVGTLGEAPESIRVIGSVHDAETVAVEDPARVACLMQTTLSVDDAMQIVAVLQRRFPSLRLPPRQDICYATQNRQDAVKALVREVELVLVAGAPNSSNSVRLCEVAAAHGAGARLVEAAEDLCPEWFDGIRSIGLTAGASAPEVLVQEVVRRLRDEFGVTSVEELETVSEDVSFAPPVELTALAAAREAP